MVTSNRLKSAALAILILIGASLDAPMLGDDVEASHIAAPPQVLVETL
ncbi:MAG: hypothetical protein AAF231_14740 [Pseudomonadota bacterium]